MPKKLTYEYVKSYIEQYDYKLLSNEYINSCSNLIFQCPEGHIFKMRFNDFKNKGERCPDCSNRKKHTYDEVKEYIESFGYILLSNEYKNNRQKLNLICPLGHMCKISFFNFKISGNRCRECRKINMRNMFKFDYEFVKSIFEKRGYILLDEEYINVETKMNYICPNHPNIISQITFHCLYYDNIGCKLCYLENNRGENHHNWKHDKTQEERLLQRGYYEYKQWRNSIYNRDDYTCQCCGKRGGKLNAHHLDSYAYNKEKRVDINNGMTLCKTCHTEFHKIYGKLNNTKKQFIEWLNLKGKYFKEADDASFFIL